MLEVKLYKNVNSREIRKNKIYIHILYSLCYRMRWVTFSAALSDWTVCHTEI